MATMRNEFDWKEYVKDVAANFGVPFGEAWSLFQILGPNETHDGFITTMEDLAIVVAGRPYTLPQETGNKINP